ncbi:NAD(P)/FAD-dependent oxidoreductase [Halobacillus sp. Marseille-Q1614]|uniref:phytoene desaturase family protein n=1 Tax=Halobacillus sp. Marseille-Q1614 TaxID=2709134 RepID=UPI001571153C|nr:NAD(P)/FAD-dependent oxidoreductase [Halobacillus sp. Marseille-Q1614]
MQAYDAAIVGAGFGGLAAGAELSKKGYKIAVFEASNELGGSAGKFVRDGYRFQSGATVGMGFEPGGVFDRFYESLELSKPPMTLLDPIMDIHLPDQTIHYYKDSHRWYQEIDLHFPDVKENVKAFYDEVFKVGALVDRLIEKRPVFPPKTISDLMMIPPLLDKDSIKLLPFMTQTVYHRLRKYGLEKHKLFLTFLNGELMDSVQTSVEYCPAFLGYTALQTFHKGAFAVHGGLAVIAEQWGEFIKQQGSDVFKRHPVFEVSKEGDTFKLSTKRNQAFYSKRVILNNSVHNFPSVVNDELLKRAYVRKSKEQERKAWGAFIIHGGVKEKVFKNTDSLYHQFIDPDNSEALHDGGQFLLSLSSRGDTTMAPEGMRSFTLSTHTVIEKWWERQEYDNNKQAMTDNLLSTVNHYFDGFTDSLDLVLPGTPVTFQKWLRRDQGKVGGYAPDGRFSWLRSYSARTGIPDLYQCGDTVFPGAGTLGVTLSGLIAARLITKD